MFSALDEKEQNIVINAMEEKTFEYLLHLLYFLTSFRPEEYVIQQGENGDNLYVVDSGKLACYKQFANNPEPTFLKNYEPGESFGELALLYNAPRAATIKAVEKSVLFALDRETFNHIVKDATMRKREEYENFLANLELTSNMDAYERSKIADAVKRVKIPAGEYVVRQVKNPLKLPCFLIIFLKGEKGDVFYLIEEGEAYATKKVGESKKKKLYKSF